MFLYVVFVDWIYLGFDDGMDSRYSDRNLNAGYIKFTEKEIVKTEPIADNIYVDLDEDGKPVGVEFFGKNVNISD